MGCAHGKNSQKIITNHIIYFKLLSTSMNICWTFENVKLVFKDRCKGEIIYVKTINLSQFHQYCLKERSVCFHSLLLLFCFNFIILFKRDNDPIRQTLETVSNDVILCPIVCFKFDVFYNCQYFGNKSMIFYHS